LLLLSCLMISIWSVNTKAHSLLQLQFLFELPTRLKKCIEMGFYGQAVRYINYIRHIIELWVTRYSIAPVLN
jgi:hypothetical protein